MYEFYPYITNDGSVGLFSPKDDDIYHSSYGAATEAYEKFIFPAMIEKLLQYRSEIRVLDICYGIGYNSKSFLNYILFVKNLKNKNFYKKYFKNYYKILSLYNDTICADNNFHEDKKLYSDTLYTDNNIIAKSKDFYKYNIDPIYSDNILSSNLEHLHDRLYKNQFFKNLKIYIKAIDNDKTLAFLSPFINSKISKNLKIQKNCINFENEKISKILNNEKSLKNEKNSKNFEYGNLLKYLLEYPDALNMLMLDNILSKYPEFLCDDIICRILSDNKFIKIFNKYIVRYFELKKKISIFNNKKDFISFLHNIYYMYLSKRYKKRLKPFNDMDIIFDLRINDARLEINSDDSEYDLIFLDAFTPSKCPCLWTLDFLKLLYMRLSNDGIILTYSNAAPIKNAFINAGFFVGKIYNPIENKFMGTIASKNSDFIKYPLSEFDLGLLKTKSGIVYRDESLKSNNEEILLLHEQEVKNSNLITASSFKKQYSSRIL